MTFEILPLMEDPYDLGLLFTTISKEEHVRWHGEAPNFLPNLRTGCADLAGGLSEQPTLCLDPDDDFGCDRSTGGIGNMGRDSGQVAAGRW